MEISIFIDHLLITLVTWIGGLALGGGFGYLCANLILSLRKSNSNNRRGIALVPWRTFLLVLLLFVWSPILPIRLGLGTSTGMVIVGLSIGLIAWFFTANTLLDFWSPSELNVRLIAGARSLLILALFATLGIGYVGGGGAGYYLMEQIKLLEYRKALQGVLQLGGMALIGDMVLGILEYWTGLRKRS